MGYEVEKYKDDIYTCVRSRCGFCFNNCPIFLVRGFETYTSRGKSMIIKAFLEKKLNLSEDLAERFSQCTNCGFCTSNCDIDRPDIFNAFKRDLINAGYSIKKHDQICKNIELCNNPYGEGGIELPLKYKKKVNNESELLYYAGCTSRYREKAIMYAMMDVLDEFAFMQDEICCGSVLLRTGNYESAEKQARKLIGTLKDYSTIVTTCAGCYNMLVHQYPKIGLKLDTEVLHSLQYVKRLLDSGELHLSKIGNGIKATYHDPCHIGRKEGIFDEPRFILKTMGFEIREMKRNRENSLCCGAGGGYKSIENELATDIANMRIYEALETDADILVSSCPFCERNLSDGKRELDIGITDIIELVAQAKYRPDMV